MLITSSDKIAALYAIWSVGMFSKDTTCRATGSVDGELTETSFSDRIPFEVRLAMLYKKQLQQIFSIDRSGPPVLEEFGGCYGLITISQVPENIGLEHMITSILQGTISATKLVHDDSMGYGIDLPRQSNKLFSWFSQSDRAVQLEINRDYSFIIDGLDPCSFHFTFIGIHAADIAAANAVYLRYPDAFTPAARNESRCSIL